MRFLPSLILTKLDGRENRKKILSNIGWLFADRVLRMGVGLVLGVWVARYLGPEQFGVYNYAIAFVTLFSVFGTLGLDSIVVRDLVNDPANRDETLGTAFVLKLLGSIVGLFLAVGSISLLRPTDSLIFWLVAIAATGITFQSFDTIDFWFQSRVQSKYTVYSKNLAFALMAIIKIILIKIEAPLITFAWAGLAEIILGFIGLIFVYQTCGNSLIKWRVSIFRAKILLTHSTPLILSSIAIIIYMKIDQIMLGEMVGNKAVGLYSAVTRISEVWYFIPTVISSSVFPAILEAKKKDKELYYQHLTKLFKLMSLVSYAVAIPTTFLSSWFMNLLYGSNYREAGIILAVHIWAGLFVCLGVVRSLWMNTENLMVFSFFTTAIGAICNILINLYMIPKFQGLGAAIATVIAYAIAAVFSCFFYDKTRRIGLIILNSMLLKNYQYEEK